MASLQSTKYVNSGFKPKSLIKKTVITNPSLYSLPLVSYSVSMTSIMDPNNETLPQIYKALEQKQQLIAQREQDIVKKHSPKKYKVTDLVPNPEGTLPRQKSVYKYPTYLPENNNNDSLQLAEKEFDKNKLKK